MLSSQREKDWRYLYTLTFPGKIIESIIIRKMLNVTRPIYGLIIVIYMHVHQHTQPESSCKDFHPLGSNCCCRIQLYCTHFTAARGHRITATSDLPAESVEINGGQSGRGASSEQWNSRDGQIQSVSHLVCPLCGKRGRARCCSVTCMSAKISSGLEPNVKKYLEFDWFSLTNITHGPHLLLYQTNQLQNAFFFQINVQFVHLIGNNGSCVLHPCITSRFA